MSLFLSDVEREAIEAARHKPPVKHFYWALVNRARKRAVNPGLTGLDTTTEWWYHVAEYVTDAAMAYALEPSDDLGIWLRDVSLSIVRRSEDDWVGPFFRNHDRKPPMGHLETAHLCLAVVTALDLAPDVFSDDERAEAKAVLRERGIPQCVRWLDHHSHLMNWRCVLAMGLAASAAYLNDRSMMARVVKEFQLCSQAFQPDGSYCESLQYSNYAAYALMIIYESLVRRDPSLSEKMDVTPYARNPRWAAYSYLYSKPLSGWGQYPKPRMANFNDCSAIFRPSGDVLMHVAARAREELPVEAGLARWLFEELYRPFPNQGPFDRATFGLVNHFGFLTLPLLTQAPQPLSPADADMPTVAAFSNGDSIARDAWGGRTVLAFRGGGDPMHAPAHLHGDLNSFILVHNQERLLLDPGHSCYRNLLRELDITTQAHNTCTFTVEAPMKDLRQEDLSHPMMLQQATRGRRLIKEGAPGPPVDRGGRRLLTAREGPVVAIASEVGRLYGPPIRQFARFCFLLGTHVLFVVDRIVSGTPTRTTWHWLLNNRDSTLEWEVHRPDRLFARRGDAGFKLFHLGNGSLSGPTYAHVHDAYHPLPNQRGEGKPGSGLLFRWQEQTYKTVRTVVHAIAVDDYGSIDGWRLVQGGGQFGLEGPGGDPRWTLEIIETAETPLSFVLQEAVARDRYQVAQDDQGRWVLGTTWM